VRVRRGFVASGHPSTVGLVQLKGLPIRSDGAERLELFGGFPILAGKVAVDRREDRPKTEAVGMRILVAGR